MSELEREVLTTLFRLDDYGISVEDFLYARDGSFPDEVIEKIKNKQFSGGMRCPSTDKQREIIIEERFGIKYDCITDRIRTPDSCTNCKYCWNLMFNRLINKGGVGIEVVKF